MIEITNLEESFDTLKKCYKDYFENKDSVFSEYIADSCVKRFEYTLETAWKLMKKYSSKNTGKQNKSLQ